MSDRRKRRTFSDIGPPTMGVQVPGPSLLSNAHKRRPSNTRTARLVMYPVPGPGIGNLSAASSMPNVPIQPMYQPPFIGTAPQVGMSNYPMPAYQMSPIQPVPQMPPPPNMPNMQPLQQIPSMPPQAQNNAPFMSPDRKSICFPVSPQSASAFEFEMERGVGQTIDFSLSPGACPVAFILNGSHFQGSERPLDVTAATKRGKNIIQFCASLRGQVTAQLRLSDPVDIDSLVKRVIEEFGPPPAVYPDPFATLNCPITNSLIVHAGRGVNCTHAQCFDLKAFIERGIEVNQWECPVCHQALEYEALRYDPNYTSTANPQPDPNTNSLFDDYMGNGFEPVDNIYLNDFT